MTEETQQQKSSRPMVIMLIMLGVLFGGIFAYKGFQTFMMKRFMATMEEPPVTVSTAKISTSPWITTLKAVGSLRAITGVSVTTSLAGMVKKIYFNPGSTVQQGTVLVQLNADTEIGTLRSLQAQVELAKITYNRDKAQFAVNAVSKQQVDTDLWNLRNLQGQTASQTGTVEKKTIRAPFSGRLGISQVNPGQYLNVGDPVTSLQTLNPIYIDFFLPQQSIADLDLGQSVTVQSDSYPDKTFTGKVTTIQPNVSTNTRNVEVEATISNPQFELAPGMFASAVVTIGSPQDFLTLPQSAITFNPYGDIVFIVHETKDKDDKSVLRVKQQFVTTGETRGDQIQILKGLKAGDVIVTSGQLKLQNDSKVIINNNVQPSDNPDPDVINK